MAAETPGDPPPYTIQVKVGAVKIYNGDPIKYANGDPETRGDGSPATFGIGVTVTYTILDEKGTPVRPESGVTLSESVELIEADPEEAGAMIPNYQGKPVDVQEGGKAEDFLGLGAGNAEDLKDLTEGTKFQTKERQTLTVKDQEGRVRAIRVQIVTKTNSNVTVEEDKPKDKPKPQAQ